jgi:hypothetical protein
VSNLSNKNTLYPGCIYLLSICAGPHLSTPSYIFTANFHLLTYILATASSAVPSTMLPALNPIAPVNEPPCAFNKAPAIGVPISALPSASETYYIRNTAKCTAHAKHGTNLTKIFADTSHRGSLKANHCTLEESVERGETVYSHGGDDGIPCE